jgi:hypothetical protein
MVLVVWEVSVAKPRKHVFEKLGIEFLASLIVFLIPYGADQMNLPHNFWVGVACLIGAPAIVIHIFWTFPVWTHRLTSLEKGLIAFIFVGLFAAILYKPVVTAYGKRKVEAEAPKLHTEATSEISSAPLEAKGNPTNEPAPVRRQLSKSATRAVVIPPGTTINATTNAPNSAAVGINTGTVTVNPDPPERNWKLSEAKCEIMLEDLGGHSGTLSVGAFISNNDGAHVAEELWRCLKKAPGWSVTRAVLPSNAESVDIYAADRDDAERAIERALVDAGFSPGHFVSTPGAAEIDVVLGKKPLKVIDRPRGK